MKRQVLLSIRAARTLGFTAVAVSTTEHIPAAIRAISLAKLTVSRAAIPAAVTAAVVPRA
jgi:hypothetical protein